MLPLAHRRILITRSRSQASDLAARLEALGGTPILIPTIEIVPPSSYSGLDEALAQLDGYEWVVFTSANAVEVFRDRLSLRTWSQSLKIAAIGPATARAVKAAGLETSLIPTEAIAESLAEALLGKIDRESRILLVRAATARDHLYSVLTAAGVSVTIAEAYRTIAPEGSISALRELFAHRANYPDAITFTSSSTAFNLLALLDAAGLTLPHSILRVSIGPITSRTLGELKLPPHRESPEATVAALAETLAAHFRP